MESLREIIDRVLPLLSYDPQAPMLFSSGLFLFLCLLYTSDAADE